MTSSAGQPLYVPPSSRMPGGGLLVEADELPPFEEKKLVRLERFGDGEVAERGGEPSEGMSSRLPASERGGEVAEGVEAPAPGPAAP